jgi:hypothetical protein
VTTKGAQCSVCGRRLTSAASVAAGVGPKCGGGGGKGKRHAGPRLRKLGGRVSASGGSAAPMDRPMPIAEALATVRQVAEKSPTWEAV